MKKLLILAALAGIGASACGDDSGDKTTEVLKDAGLLKDGAVVVRPQQIDNSKVGLACTTANATTTCTGVGATCLTTQGPAGMEVTYPNGYCSATCETTLECGTGAACPVAEIILGIPAAFQSAVSPSLLASFGIPVNCLAKCTTATDCRTGYICDTVLSQFGGGMVPAAAQAFTGGAAFTATYCLPPAPVTDGGVTVQHDAGTTTTINGMDAGV